MTLDLETAYKVDGHGGMAWRIEGYVMIRDEDYDWTGIEYADESRVRMHMIGDDRTFEFGVDEIIPIDDDDYCSECGQIGCKADGR